VATGDDVIAVLEQARQKLVAAKSQGLRAASIFGRAHSSVGHVVGRSGAGSPLLSDMKSKEKGLVEQVMTIDALIGRIDKAIAQAKSATTTAGAGGPSGARRDPGSVTRGSTGPGVPG
jgi:hypothetical protein